MEAIIINAAFCLGIEITKEIYQILKNDSLRGGLADIKLSMKNHTEAYREVESPNIVYKIAKSSVEFDESTNELHTHFFYTNNNIVTKQLLGGKYFAFDSIPDMFDTISTWNYTLATQASKMKRSSMIYMLDPHPAPIHLSHMEFLQYFNNVTIVNHVQAKQMLSISSVKIHKGCSVKFEHLTISHDDIDVTDGGCAYLHKCIVGTTAPTLDIPTTTLSHDWQHDSGKVIFRECMLSPPTVNKKWKPSLGRKKNDHGSILIDGILSQIVNRMNSKRDGNKSSTSSAHNYVDGGVYVGELKDGKRNGQGTYTFADGAIYVGEWKDDYQHGHGTYNYANGDVYVGEWKDGKRSQGTYTFADGAVYVGEWKDGKRNG